MNTSDIEDSSDRELAVETLVADGLHFLSSLTHYYGVDRGMEVWNSMGAAVGEELRGRIFFAMLTGRTSDRIRFRAGMAEGYGHAVAVVKAIRSYTGSGLKEAKDLWDASKISTQSVVVRALGAGGVRRDARDLARELRDLGCDVV